MDISSPLISTETLSRSLGNPALRLFFTSMKDPFSGKDDPLPDQWISGTQVFDFETVFCEPDSELHHSLPSAERFSRLVGQMGVSSQCDVVVYDARGLYSAARAWYMFRLMGHQRVWVLDGGLPEWLKAGHPCVSPDETEQMVPQDFLAIPQWDKVVRSEQILLNLQNHEYTVVDARSAPRFSGKAKEPRVGVRSGHIPGSVNLPFTQLLSDGRLHDKARLQTLFDVALQGSRKPVFSCGSGVTACILALACEVCGGHEWAVYDGSWSEWGSDPALPVATA